MQKLLLLGDEAIAQGAIDGGISGFYAYPGTPSTEIMEYAQKSKEVAQKGIHCKWSANEKTAMEAAIGMSYTGKRAMVQMKHVGMNVAADPFLNSSITGVNGGLIVVAADDPSMHSSQNEQDSRFYGDFALVPILEPSNQQEAYEMAKNGFELSEKFNVPIVLRVTTRLAHSRADIKLGDKKEQLKVKLPEDPRQYVLLPGIARRNYKKLLEMQSSIQQASNDSIYNRYIDGNNKKIGIVACGIGFNYLMENFDGECPYPVVKVSQYPIPKNHIQKLRKECESILVLEDGYQFVEKQLKSFFDEGIKIMGRLDGSLPRDGELNPNIVAKALGIKDSETLQIPEVVKMRPPSLCQGCGHRDVYEALNIALEDYEKGRVFADIGCYTLGALPPFNTVNSCVDMGASITMAIGASDAGLIPAVAVIGDSTFTHSGMTGLLDAVIKNSPILVLISDNFTTGMTGGQDSAAKNRIVDICKGIGVNPDHLRTIVPLKSNYEKNLAIIKEELAYNGLSVVVAQRECIQTAKRGRKQQAKNK